MQKETTVTSAQAAAGWQAFEYAATFDVENGYADEHTFQLYVRPSGVVDLFVVGSSGGYTSDVLFHVGYVTRRGAWVETGAGSDEIELSYFDGPAAWVETVVVPA